MATRIQTLHAELLSEIVKKSGKPTKHTFQDNYLGNSHPRYPISNPILRITVRTWFRANQLSPKEFIALLTSLIQAPSSTEKLTAGILLDYASKDQLIFDPKIYDRWLNNLIGWVEVDTLCYGHFKIIQVLEQWSLWKKLLLKLNNSKNINKRRASLVLLCKPLTRTDDKRVQVLALKLIDQLKSEKEVLITKAISWTLRSMVKLNRAPLTMYIMKNKQTLPAIAVRETLTKLKTGRKTKKPD
ncbi:MAG TPA: DNA alkylation repair protein [Cyclobacteriaceae bacterium]|jgi:3-methyladenine DNA glycosylase AlkD|nr:DNA alkylation repair protein [Cyclobacteriaceae bacterium]